MTSELNTPILTVGVIGLGRVGSAIVRAVAALPRESGFRLVGVSTHRLHDPCTLADEVGVPVLGQVDLLCFADLCVLAAPDDALPGAAADLAAAFHGEVREDAGALVHCSGALDGSVLDPVTAAGWTVGAWHPLQAFPTTASPLRAGITWAVTAPEPLAGRLRALSAALGGRPVDLGADAKPRYHAAASMAANYLVTQAWHAVCLLEHCGLSRAAALAALVPLLESTVAGLAAAGLPDGLTGPLARGDVATIARHLDALDGAPTPDTAALYRTAGMATLPLLAARGADAGLLSRLTVLLGGSAPPAAQRGDVLENHPRKGGDEQVAEGHDGPEGPPAGGPR